MNKTETFASADMKGKIDKAPKKSPEKKKTTVSNTWQLILKHYDFHLINQKFSMFPTSRTRRMIFLRK